MPLFFCLVRVLLGKMTNFLPFSLFGSGGTPGRPDPLEGGKYRAKEQKCKGGGEEEDDTTQGTGWLVLFLVSGNKLDKSIFIKLMGRSREMHKCTNVCAFVQQAFRNVLHV